MNKPETCTPCSLAETGQGFAPDEAPTEQPDVIFMAEALGKNERIQARPMVGDAGFVLKNWGIGVIPELKLLYEQKRIQLSNTLRCEPPAIDKRHYPTGEIRVIAERTCRQYDNAALRSGTCPIVLLGEVPQRLIFHAELEQEDVLDKAASRKVKGVMGRIGRVMHKNGRKYVFAQHPAAVLRHPAQVEHFQRSLVRVLDKWKPFVVESVPFEQAVPQILAAEEIGYDGEWGQDRKITVNGISWDQGRRACAWPRSETGDALVRDALRGRLAIGHNALAYEADRWNLVREGFGAGKWFDTLLGLHTTHNHLAGADEKDPGPSSHGMFSLRSAVLLYGTYGGEQPDVDWKRYETDIFATCREDAAMALRVAHPMKQRINTQGLQPTCDLAHEIAPIFALIKERGVRMDKDALGLIYNERKERVARLINEFGLTEIRGKKKLREVPIWRSPVVLDRFETAFGIRLANNQKATWAKVAREAKGDAQVFAQAILDLKKGANDAHWIGTVTEEEGELEFSKLDGGGYIHPEYRIYGSPDRPIAGGPNIQNFPRVKDDPRTVKLRSAVIAPNIGMALVACDFQALETVTQAYEAGDTKRVQDTLEGRLTHEATARTINAAFGLSLTRQQGKTFNHAFDKGMTPYQAAALLTGQQRPDNDTKRLCGKALGRMLFDYPLSAKFRDDLWERSIQNPLVVQNKFGRRYQAFSRSKYGDASERWAKHDPTMKYWCPCAACVPRRERWKYALSFLGRSCGADITLRVMARVWNEQTLGDNSLCYIECHDELVYAIPLDRAQQDAVRLQQIFEAPVPELGGLKLKATVGIGRSWADAK